MSLNSVIKTSEECRIVNFGGGSNYHTHTYYCDGKNSPKEMVERAVELGFHSLGFSGHQYSPQDADYAMSLESEKKYRSDIEALREEYKGIINIYLGIERDYCCEATEGFQYIIGSTHHVQKDGIWMNVDESAKTMEDSVKQLFDGDYMAYAEAYYDLESRVLEKTRGQIVGHFDLITVFNGMTKDVFFNEEDPFYKGLALKAAERIVESFVTNRRSNELPEGFPAELGEIICKTEMPIFEINMGAMAKGRRDIPYPAPFIMEYLATLNVPMLISTDCHDKRFLDYGMKELSF